MSEFIHNDMSKKNPFRRLLSYIPDGEENAISMQALADCMDLSPRALRRLIQCARTNGNIIASSDNGYYIPVDLEGLKRFYNRYSSRLRSCASSIAPVRKLIREEEDCLDDENYSLFTDVFDDIEDMDSLED